MKIILFAQQNHLMKNCLKQLLKIQSHTTRHLTTNDLYLYDLEYLYIYIDVYIYKHIPLYPPKKQEDNMMLILVGGFH